MSHTHRRAFYEKYSHEVRLAISSLLAVALMVAIVSIFGLAPEKNAHSSGTSKVTAQGVLTYGHHLSEKEIVRGDTTKKQVIFTFDAGDGTDSADAIFSALAKYHVKGTFFVTGKFTEAHPNVVRHMIATGNEVFSHTFDHSDLTTLSNSQIADEFSKTESILLSVVGTSPKPFFRAPYGARDSRVLSDAFKAGYQSVYWTVDARDWMESQGETDQEVTNRIMQNLAPGTIYLMHVGDGITGRILDTVFSSIQNRGYSIVSLTQGL